MKIKRDLPTKPDWYFVDARVEAFWDAADLEPPLTPQDLLTIFRTLGCKVKTYRELSQKLDISVDEVGIRLGSKDGNVCYDARRGRYSLAYDSEGWSARMRWTLAHELGHIILAHLEDFPQTNVRKKLPIAFLTILDKEADKFASEILAPAPLLIGLAESAHRPTQELYYALARDIFGLSRLAAYYRARDICRRHDRIVASWTDDMPAVYQKHMSKFLALYGSLSTDTFAGRIWMGPYRKEYQYFEAADIQPAAAGE